MNLVLVCFISELRFPTAEILNFLKAEKELGTWSPAGLKYQMSLFWFHLLYLLFNGICSRSTEQNYCPHWNHGPNRWSYRNYHAANCIWSNASPVGRLVPSIRPKPNTFPNTEVPSTLHGDLWPPNIFPTRQTKTSNSFLFISLVSCLMKCFWFRFFSFLIF